MEKISNIPQTFLILVSNFFCDRVAILEKGHVIEALSADYMHKNVAHPIHGV